jgi:hypothetical protein
MLSYRDAYSQSFVLRRSMPMADLSGPVSPSSSVLGYLATVTRQPATGQVPTLSGIKKNIEALLVGLQPVCNPLPPHPLPPLIANFGNGEDQVTNNETPFSIPISGPASFWSVGF